MAKNKTEIPGHESITDTPENIITTENEIVSSASLFAYDPKSYNAHVKIINDALSSVKKSFFKIASALDWIDRTKSYLYCGNSASICEFAEARFGIGKSSTYNYLNVAGRFGIRDDNGDITGIDERYRDYSPTQLILLSDSGLDYDDIKSNGLEPSMTCNDMKRAIRLIMGGGSNGRIACRPVPDSANDGVPGHGGALSSPSPDSGAVHIPSPDSPPPSYTKSTPLITIRGMDDFDRKKDGILELIMKSLSQDGLKCAVTISMEWD